MSRMELNMFFKTALGWKRGLLGLCVFVVSQTGLSGTPAQAEQTAFMQAVAQAAARNAPLSEFYQSTGYDSIWTGRDDRRRRKELISAFRSAAAHGLPSGLYDADHVTSLLANAKTHRQRGEVEVELSRLYLDFARDLSTGVIERPSRIDDGIVRRISRHDPVSLLEFIANNSARSAFRGLVPDTPEYSMLLAEKQRLEQVLGQGGWGAGVPGSAKLEAGDRGPRVIALRDRLVRMGYLRRNASATFDDRLSDAVKAFQNDHGLATDGVAGPATLGEINKSVTQRMASVVVAMERERWLTRDRGQRHILVNLTDFTAKIVDDGRVTFQTRSVVGANDEDRRSPEFSDVMEHMVLNPTWNVPRSIAVKEYLPMLKEDPLAVQHLNVIGESGQTVDRTTVDFTQFDEENFPFDLKEPPSRGNALGLVKFMFPNRHNIYLHDTPADHLFAREVRAFSHGCIRLNDPFEFAYALLAKQDTNPEAYFHTRLNTGRETVVDLVKDVPVHLIYRTAFGNPQGKFNFRRDIYGRDAKIWRALRDAGVELRALRS